MQADYESRPNTIQITLEEVDRADYGDEVHERAIVVVAAGRPVMIDLLYPDLGIAVPLAAVADRYHLGRDDLLAAATAALAVPDRPVTIEVGPRFADEEAHAA
jgi:hypothetical protein